MKRTASKKALDELENCVVRMTDVLVRLQSENQSAKEEIQRLQNDLDETKRDNQIKNELIERLEKDRLRIRSRVERVLEKVTFLEKAGQS